MWRVQMGLLSSLLIHCTVRPRATCPTWRRWAPRLCRSIVHLGRDAAMAMSTPTEFQVVGNAECLIFRSDVEVSSVEPLCNARIVTSRRGEAMPSYSRWIPFRGVVRDVVSCVDGLRGAKAAILSLSSPVCQGSTRYMPSVAGRRRLSFD